ncbi:FAD-dependent oxidoreductase [Flavobacterium sp.]|uniref:FAD-dependent oxidoreductase n=1 Tax=Flavobacterium sp. TaxID=239 RepID=UPI002BE380CF|nr:FAD-dependent oxidoreductase [Flavobacterium sp.]HSD07988.1 FAD-dependent oxidoreductase [Flavobacterium sp.]
MKNMEDIDEKLTNGKHHSYWIDSVQPLAYSRIEENKETDILIIGGGIAGLSTAYNLSKSGRKVILVENGYLGSGESGRTTAQITYALDDRYFELEKIYGTEVTKEIASSHKNALKWIQSVIEEEKIDCDYKIVNAYLFPSENDNPENLQKEYSATRRMELETKILNDIPSFKTDQQRNTIQFSNQAQFHILKYLKGLADAIIRMGGEIYTNSKAEKISKSGAVCNGFTISANQIVVATNTPINNIFTIHTKQWAYRSYVIGAKIPKGTLPYAMWWDTGNQESKWATKPYHYVRLQPLDDEYDLLISGGEDHKTGQANEQNLTEHQRFENLIQWTNSHFPYFSEVQYQWTGQLMEPVDSLAFIGKNPGDKNIFIITGHSGNGMNYGTIGGILISDLINGKSNSWEKLYSPARITLKTGNVYMQEVGNMAVNMVKGWFNSDISKTTKLPANCGAIINNGLEKIAVYRNPYGKLIAFSAVCPHMGGILKWNNEEKTFDCPLHGSRFNTQGHVACGPAISNLKEKKVPKD